MNNLDEVPVFITNIKIELGNRARRRLTDQQAMDIYNSNLPAKALAINYNMTLSAIYKIKKGTAYKDINKRRR
jgi:hypothetical protein